MKFGSALRKREIAVIVLFASFLIGCASARPVARSKKTGTMKESTRFKFDRAYEAIRADQFQEASEIFAEILNSDPRNLQARRELAYLYLRLKRWPEAIRHLDTALDGEPDNMRLRMDLGHARLNAGARDAAVNDFKLVASRNSEWRTRAQSALRGLRDAVSDGVPDARRDKFLNEGYTALRRGDPGTAREKFKSVLALDPGNTAIYKQLGYMSLAEGDAASAAVQFDGVHRLDPTDYRAALQLGYLYDSLHNAEKSEQAFKSALRSPDPQIRAAAKHALANIQASKKRVFLDVNASPYYAARFGDRIAYADAQLGYKPNAAGPLSFYMGGRYVQDSRSHGGNEPQIYSDNVALAGLGIKFQPRGTNAQLSVETNAAFNLIRRPEHPDAVELDFRLMLADYHYWNGRFSGPLGLLTLGQAKHPRLFTQIGFSAGYYGRYQDNIIGYFQSQEGFKLWENGSSLLTAYLPMNLIKDKNRDFFNNLVEAGFGMEIQPRIRTNLKLRAEVLRGVYFGIEGRDRNPFGAHYDDFRIMLLYSGRFTNAPW